ncbi:hypothetical protein [Microbulbifer litoralis]|uniref:hypothetical protein n=1 Tax=Microbulbifer litoralis TaxID=2933965 RepID=UPI0020299072|nr:hypothetical protein [Microbulbifer sp. GX H0434]
MKKVQFCLAVALVASALQAGAAELSIPIDEVQQQLARKAEENFSRKLDECRDDREPESGDERSGPRYPVRIAASEPASGLSGLYAGTLLAAP